MCRSVLKIMTLCLVLLGNVCSFGMIVPYKGKPLTVPLTLYPMKFDKLPPETKEQVINHLDNPITFGQTNKQNHTLVKELGMHNVCLAYKKKDPNFFLSHYVPVLFLDTSPLRRELYGIFISPYHIISKSESAQQLIDKKIVELGNKRLEQAYEQQKNYGGNSFGVFGFSKHSCLIDSLIFLAVLFENNENMFQRKSWFKIGNNDITVQLRGNTNITRAIRACIQYRKNNALELLLSAIDTECHGDNIRKGESFYELLLLADKTKNKEAFAFLAAKDPYNERNLIWKHLINENTSLCDPNPLISGTNLDHMIREGNFDQENIEIYIKHGGKTVQELKDEKA
jgi:hypothetical protein